LCFWEFLDFGDLFLLWEFFGHFKGYFCGLGYFLFFYGSDLFLLFFGFGYIYFRFLEKENLRVIESTPGPNYWISQK